MILPRRACGLHRHHRPFDSHEGEGQHGLMPQLDVSHMLSAMAHAAGLPAALAAGWMAAFHYRQGALGPGRTIYRAHEPVTGPSRTLTESEGNGFDKVLAVSGEEKDPGRDDRRRQRW